MKTKSPAVFPSAFAVVETNVAKLIGATAFSIALLLSPAAPGATISWTVPNADAEVNLLLVSDLELQNPLQGTETILGHAVLEWRDADYLPDTPQPYADWSVSNPLASGGDASRIFLLQGGISARTTTTVPSTVVSIHLDGDFNDGGAQVSVDGNPVALLDMSTAFPNDDTVLVVVKGLANTTHTIEVFALGDLHGGIDDDVHILGAAALKESPLKWNQPPVVTNTANVFNGWNETSVYGQMPMIADDWVCTTTNPVTGIRWWGSFAGWQYATPPLELLPTGFIIDFWPDIPATPDQPSHPAPLHFEPEIYCNNYTWRFVGWDYDPRTGQYEACFEFYQSLTPDEWFHQDPLTGTNIYWISISAIQPQTPFLWGWKTRPRDIHSPAPDAAVRFAPNGGPYEPIYWPVGSSNAWDMAFELITGQTGNSGVKWEMPPDLTPNGVDVNDSGGPPPFLLAAQFICSTPGPLTNITIWGSWSNDIAPQNLTNMSFTVSIHADVPQGPGVPFGRPGNMLWMKSFNPGTFHCSTYGPGGPEGWLTPPTNNVNPGDFQCYQYDFPVTSGAFNQQGTVANPIIYWLDVQAFPPAPCTFGWKSSSAAYNALSVWVGSWEQYNGAGWQRLLYHPAGGPPLQTNGVYLAFRVETAQPPPGVKWSQPPVPGGPGTGYNGWNELSVSGGQIDPAQAVFIADDWACTTTNPVTDIYWWGSFLGWSQPTPPQMPDMFQINFWTDVPAVPGNPNSFSHPGQMVHQLMVTHPLWWFAGWDFDPRNPNALPEACFEFALEMNGPWTNSWFYQDPGTGTNIYWISINALYYNATNLQYLWGWKSRPRDPGSLAPDDAVRSVLSGSAPEYEPIWWPARTNSWDMAFVLGTRETEAQDFGDAPDSYPTLLTNNAARHFILPGFCLGHLIDAETNGLPGAIASGDDTNNLADEDGVIFSPPLLVGTQAWVKVVLTSPSGSGQLDAWLDFNRNGSWESAEQIFNSQTLSSGTNTLSVPVPASATLGPTFARFRLSSTGGLSPTGAAADGEVEDHLVTLMQHRPATNIVITNIAVVVSNVTIVWTAEADVHYRLQAATNLSNPRPVPWSNVGPEVIGLANSQTETNSPPPARYYRVIAPYVWP
jgi:hypothetical protein